MKTKSIKGGYVDGFVIPVPKNKINVYKKIASLAGKVWMEHGAIDYKECVGDDMNLKMPMSFMKISKAMPNETVVFSWILYKNKKHRDSVNAKVMKDPRIAKMMKSNAMPFDMKKMSYGGFKVIVDYRLT